MSRIPLSLACWDYDRTRALADGTVAPEGVDLTYLCLPIEETFFRMLRHREFDAAEMSLSSYVTHLGTCTRAGSDPDFVALPVFPSRAFRHHGVYVRAESPIREPRELVGRIVGVPEYQLTAAVWIRGILADRHELPVDAVRYRTGGMHAPGRVEKQVLDLPAGVEVEPIPADRTLVDMLLGGEIDALYAPRTPAPMLAGDGRVRHLFDDPRAEEEQYARETRIFPIMHLVVLRREVHRAHPWVAAGLTAAFGRAKRRTEERMAEAAANPTMVPWLADELERTRALLGGDFWPYGLAENVATLQVFLRYAHEQGLTHRRLEPAELFAEQTLEQYVI